jgi:catechol 2,3-dioxygenase-like lactoylglutathione lyase family enzyme
MTNVIRLEHVALPTTEENFAETVKFYQDNFGWTTIREIGSGGSAIAFLSDDAGSALEIYVAPGQPMTHPAHIAFAVPITEYDDLKAKLEAAGVTFDINTENAAGDRLGYFHDPAGNRAQIVGRIKALRD